MSGVWQSSNAGSQMRSNAFADVGSTNRKATTTNAAMRLTHPPRAGQIRAVTGHDSGRRVACEESARGELISVPDCEALPYQWSAPSIPHCTEEARPPAPFAGRPSTLALLSALDRREPMAPAGCLFLRVRQVRRRGAA